MLPNPLPQPDPILSCHPPALDYLFTVHTALYAPPPGTAVVQQNHQQPRDALRALGLTA